MLRLIFIFFCIAAISVCAWAEELYYIYKDNKGRTYIEDSISANHAKYGYRVVNAQGTTLRTVPSIAEQQRKEEKRRKRTEAAQAKEAKHERDDYLLQTFMDVEDIRQAGNKKIMALQNQIETTNNHIKAFEENLKELETQIQKADQEKREITQADVDAIERIKESIQQNKFFVQRKIDQQQQTRDEYVEYIRRFQELKAAKK